MSVLPYLNRRYTKLLKYDTNLRKWVWTKQWTNDRKYQLKSETLINTYEGMVHAHLFFLWGVVFLPVGRLENKEKVNQKGVIF